MKRILLSGIFLVFIFSCYSPRVVTLSTFTQERNISMDGYEKEKLYVNTNRWMARLFNNRTHVVQYEDKEAGVIVGKFLANSESLEFSDLQTTIEAIVKDGHIRLSFWTQYYPTEDGETMPGKVPERLQGYYELTKKKETNVPLSNDHAFTSPQKISRYWDILEQNLREFLQDEQEAL